MRDPDDEPTDASDRTRVSDARGRERPPGQTDSEQMDSEQRDPEQRKSEQTPSKQTDADGDTQDGAEVFEWTGPEAGGPDPAGEQNAPADDRRPTNAPAGKRLVRNRMQTEVARRAETRRGLPVDDDPQRAGSVETGETGSMWRTLADAVSDVDAPSIGAVFESARRSATEPERFGGDEAGSGVPHEDDETPSRSHGPTTVDVDRYLLAGESSTTTVPLGGGGGGWLVVTTHRVLVFDPDADGRRFHSVDRLNVVDVEASGGGDARVLGWVGRAVVYAVVLGGGGLLARSVGLRSLFTAGTTAADAPGVSGLAVVLSGVSALVGLLVDGLLVAGLLAGVVALGLAAVYVRRRHPTLVLSVAGAEPLEVGLASSVDPDETAAVVRDALETELAL